MRPKSIPHPPIESGTPLEKFLKFAKQIISVPKAEIDKREAKWKKEHASTKKLL